MQGVGRGSATMTKAADDAQLIKRVATRDENALRTLFTRHQVPVFRYIVRLVRNDAVAEELTNEVFLDVWRNAPNFEARSSARTWVLSIAHHRAVSALRKRREEGWDEDRVLAVADTDDNPEVSAQKHDKSTIMRRCMDKLTSEHREIIDLVYYQELSISEVGKVVGIPENTVKTRMFYARKRLSALLVAAGLDRGWP
jgi:RNA polymerase sigma-70 factor, ECF subfamily